MMHSPVCCNDCGPEVYLTGREETGERAAIIATRKMIHDGGIVAIKGIGGFHLCCDATNEEAVQRLRTLKNRPAKPFAVMARDVEAVKQECLVNEVQEEILDGHQKPILLLEKRKNLQTVQVFASLSLRGIQKSASCSHTLRYRCCYSDMMMESRCRIIS